MPYDVIDADGHVTETLGADRAAPGGAVSARRPLQTPFFPQDGWDRRLIGTKGDWAGDAKSWTSRARRGRHVDGGALPHARPLHRRSCATPSGRWRSSRAYNTMLYKELTSQSRASRPWRCCRSKIPRRRRASSSARSASSASSGRMLSADGYYLLGHKRFDPIYADGRSALGVPLSRPRGGARTWASRRRALPEVHPGPHRARMRSRQMRQFTSMMFDGVPVRFPELTPRLPRGRLGGSPTSSSGWTRSGERGARRGQALGGRRPTTSGAAASTFSCEADEPLLPQALPFVGDDRILRLRLPALGPQLSESVKELADRADLTDDQKRRILGATARRFYTLA